MKPACALAAGFLLFAPVAWGGAPALRASATLSWAGNISRTSDPVAERDATTLDVTAAATLNRQVTRDWFGWASAEAASFADFDFELTNRAQVGVRAGWRRKFGLGPQAPTLDFSAGLARRLARYDGSDGWVVEASARVSKRLGDTVRLGLTGEWQQIYARHSTFDTRHTQAGLDVAWDFADGWQASAGAGRLWGDVVANASGPTYAQALAGGFGPVVQAYYSAISFETNQLYGPNWVSYRVHAQGDSVWLSLSYAFNDSTSLAARIWTIEVVNQVGIRYDTEFWSLTLAHRF